MSLIDRYIAEVGRHLPEKDRSDIEAEIRTMVEDMVDERRERGGTASSGQDKVITETLEELGDPKLLAAKYSPSKRYLIGPVWYEIYLTTLRRVLWLALPIFAAVTFIVSLTENPLGFINALGEAVGGAFSVGLQILFWVTIVFVFLERSEEVPEEGKGSNAQPWTIARLPAMPTRRQISVGETLTNIGGLLFVILWVLLPPMRAWMRGDTDYVSFLHPNLWNFWLPVFFVLMILTLIHELFKLRIGNWTPALTMTNVVLCLISILYIVLLVTTQDVINPAFLGTLDGSQLARLRDVTSWASWTVYITAAVFIGIYVYDMVNSIWLGRQLKQREHRTGFHVVLL